MIDIATALASIQTTVDLIKAGIEARDQGKVRAAVADLSARYADLSMAALALSEKLRAVDASLAQLERENRELRKQLEERLAYKLYEVKPGLFCYRFEPSADSEEPAHYLCQPCYDKGVKSVMRQVRFMGESERLNCPSGQQAHTLYL